MSGIDGWVPVPHEALNACDVGEWHAVVDLYKRANALRWRSFRFTERSLCERWKLSNRRVWSLLDTLAELGLVEVTRGGKRVESTILVRCPTRESGDSIVEARHRDQHKDQQNGQGSNGASGEPAAQGAAQVAAPPTRANIKSQDQEFQQNTDVGPASPPLSPLDLTADPTGGTAPPVDAAAHVSRPTTQAATETPPERPGAVSVDAEAIALPLTLTQPPEAPVDPLDEAYLHAATYWGEVVHRALGRRPSAGPSRASKLGKALERELRRDAPAVLDAMRYVAEGSGSKAEWLRGYDGLTVETVLRHVDSYADLWRAGPPPLRARPVGSGKPDAGDGVIDRLWADTREAAPAVSSFDSLLLEVTYDAP